MANIDFIVLRSSPDWRTFDIQQSRQFCQFVGIPADAVIDFANTWDATFKISYREFRAVCKEIAFRSFTSCVGMEVIRRDDIARYLGHESRLFFTDDDDWFHPHIASICRDLVASDQGGYWGSIRHGYRPWIPAHEEFSELVIEKRPLKPALFTNNYFVTGRQAASASLDAFFEHSNAHNEMLSGRLQMAPIGRYLSCANKHPACTVFLTKAMEFSQDRRMLYDLLSAARTAFETRSFDAETAWVQPYSDDMVLLLQTTLDSRKALTSANAASA